MRQDARYALRHFPVHPGASVLVVIMFALGIGLNTALFTFVNALLVRSLPGYQTDRIVTIWNKDRFSDTHAVSSATVRAWRAQARSFERIEAGAFNQFNFSGGGRPEVVRAVNVTSGFFALHRVQARHGRAFLPDDDQPAHTLVAVLDHDFWAERFGGDPAIVGRTVRLDRRSYIVAGILPADFHPFGRSAVAVYVPLVMEELPAWDFWTVARLRAGVGLAAARAEMAAVSCGLQSDDPAGKDVAANVVPLQEIAHRTHRTGLLLLFGAVALVLLIACLNIANLVLARAAARTREFAVRLALGATRGRLVRQLLTEGLLLSGGGGVLGLVLALAAVPVLVKLNAGAIPGLDDVRADAAVALFAAGLAVAAGLFANLGPALSVLRHDLNPSLKPAGSGRRAVVVVEIAIAFVLVAVSALALKSFSRLQRIDPGYESRGVLTMMLSSPLPEGGEPANLLALYRRIAARLAALPGVEAVGLATRPPLGGIGITRPLRVTGEPSRGKDAPEAELSMVGPGYFRAIGLPLRRGRDFTTADRDTAAPVAIVSESVARRVFAGEDPIGRRLDLEGFDPNVARMGKPVAREIVGVAGDILHENLKEAPGLDVYLPLEQNPISFVSVVLRSRNEVSALARAAEREILREDPDLPVSEVKPMEERMRELLGANRQAAGWFTGFAGLALLLTALGVYGVVAAAVSRRVKEIGVRMALGATTAVVLRLVLRESLSLGVCGVVLGTAGALAAGRVLGAALFGIEPGDPVTLAGVSAAMLLLSLAAAWLPARTASRVDPATVLRTE